MVDPRFELYEKLLPLLDKDIDGLFEMDKHNFLGNVQELVQETKEELNTARNIDAEVSLIEWCKNLIPHHKVNKELNLVRETFKLIVDEYLNLEEMHMHRMLVTSTMEVLNINSVQQANAPDPA